MSLVIVDRWSSKETLVREEKDDLPLFVVVRNYKADGGHQLNLKKSDEVRLITYSKNGKWCEVFSASNQLGWVPRSCITPVTPLVKHPWYHGSVSRRHTEFLLSFGINGTFLVRESESIPGRKSISIKCDGDIYHYKINEDREGKVFLARDKKFDTIPELVQHYHKRTDGIIEKLLYASPKLKKSRVFSLSPETSGLFSSICIAFDNLCKAMCFTRPSK